MERQLCHLFHGDTAAITALRGCFRDAEHQGAEIPGEKDLGIFLRTKLHSLNK